MKNIQIKQLKQALDNVSNYPGVKFSFKVSYNSRLLTNQIEAFDTSIKPNEDYKEFLTKKQELLSKYADKDDNGEPKTEKRSNDTYEYIINDRNMKKFEKAFDKLKDEFSEAINFREKQESEYEGLMNDEFEDFNNLKLIKPDELPSEITLSDLVSIYNIIDNNFDTTEVEVQNRQLVEFINGINLMKDRTGLYLILPLVYNYDKLTGIFNEIIENTKYSEEFFSYERERMGIAMKYAKLDTNNKPIIQPDESGNNSFIIENVEDFNNEIKSLMKKYEKALKAKSQKDLDNEVYLKQTRKISIAEINLEDLPEDSTANELKSISFMIKD